MSARQIAVNKAIQMLDAAGAQYAIQFEGESYGALEVVVPNGSGRRKRYDYKAIYRPFVVGLEVGHSVKVPVPGDLEKHGVTTMMMYQAIYAYGWTVWGRGNFILAVEDEGKNIEVLRIA